MAGDRVITDPLCKPFSMGRYLNLSFDYGLLHDRLKCNISNPFIDDFWFFFSCFAFRNLICVYSKKHMNDDPELVDMKRKANTRSLKEMATLLR